MSSAATAISHTRPSPVGTALTRDAVNGRATGALFFVGFGAVWLFTGLRGLHLATRGVLSIAAVFVAGLLLLTAWLMRRAQDLPSAVLLPERDVRAEKMFTAINIIQWVSVATAIGILNILHLAVFIVPAVSIIVGLHLYPLAGTFHYRQHYVTGGLLVTWPLGCMALLSRDHLPSVCAAGIAAVLLGSATSTLLRCFFSLRGASVPALAAQS